MPDIPSVTSQAEVGEAESQQCDADKIKFSLVLDKDSSSSFPDYDVVAVHGLQGDFKNTSGTSYGTCTWLKKGLFPDQNVRIMEYNYGTSDTSGIICTRIQFSDEASKLLGCLLELRKKADEASETQRPLIFIAHDLGAIIVKKALHLAGLDPAKFGTISNSTASVVFFGCPHRFTSSEDMEEKLARLILLHGRSPRQSLTTVIETLGESIIEINNAFIDTKMLIKLNITNVFYDAEDPPRQIFDQFTVTMDVPFENQVRLDSQHVELVNTSNGNTYSVANPPGGISYPSRPDDSMAQYMSTLISQASPIYPLKAANGSGHPVSELNWIHEDDTFKKWLARRDTSILHVHGISGVPKAAKCIFQYLTFVHHSSTDHSVLYFEFKRYDTRFNTLKSMLSTFLAQITGRYKGLEEQIVRNFERFSLYRCWTDKDLFAFLEDLRLTRRIDGITYVISGLEQCDESRNWFLAELLSIARRSESRYKVVITSMGNKEIRDVLSEFPNIDLDDHRNMDKPNLDVALAGVGFELAQLLYERPQYCAFETTFRQILSECGTDAQLRRLIVDWFRFNNHLTKRSAIEGELRRLSPVCFTNVLETIMASIAPERQDWARKIIAFVSCSFQPLTIWELRLTLSLDTDNEGRRLEDIACLDLLVAIHRYFGSLFIVENGEMCFGHPSARDFFIRSESDASEVRPWYQFEGEGAAHAEITSFCLYHLSLPEVEKQTEEFLARHSNLSRSPILDSRFDLRSYTTMYWPDHCRLALSSRSESESRNLTTQAVEESDDRSISMVEAARNDHVKTVQLLLNDFGPDHSTLQNAIKAATSRSEGNLILDLLECASRSIEKFEWPQGLLCRAAWLGLDNVVRRLIQAGAKPNPPTPLHGMSPLHLAARNNHTKVAKTLLGEDASLTCKTLFGTSVLETACAYGHADVVRLIIQKSSDLEVEEKAGLVPLQYTCDGGHHQAVEVMLKARIDWVKKGRHLLISATKSGYIECCRSLLQHGADTEVEGGNPTPLWYAVRGVNIEICRLLLEYRANPNHRPDDDSPILMLAVDADNVELVELLLDHGAEIEEEDESASYAPTALSRAAKNGSKDLVSCLIRRNADVNRPNKVEDKPVYVAARHGHAEVLQLLLDAGADVNVYTSDGWGPLHIARDSSEVARVLLKNGADVNHGSPLYYASGQNWPEVVKMYLQHKEIELDKIEDKEGFTAIITATYHGNTEIVRLLLEAGANVNQQAGYKNAPLHYALDSTAVDSVNTLRALLEYNPSLDLTNDSGATPLNWLDPTTPVSLIRLMINAGANLEIPNNARNTPLCTAVLRNNVEVVNYLVTKKARVNIIGYNGGPLHLACHSGSFEIVKILVDGGADVNLADPSIIGTPLHYACLGEAEDKDWESDDKDREPDDKDRESNHRDELIDERFDGEDGIKDPVDVGDQEMDGQDGTEDQNLMKGRDKVAQANRRESVKRQIIRYLVEAGADVNVASGPLGYLLNAACFKGTPGIVKYLLDKGARPDVKDSLGRIPIHIAASRTLDHFELLFDEATYIPAEDILGRTPLHYAVVSGRVDLVKRVLELSPGLANAPDCDEWTPLLWAARTCGGQEMTKDEVLEIFELLLANGADLWVKGQGLDREWSPLMVARYHGADEQVIKLLTPASKRRVKNGVEDLWDDDFRRSKGSTAAGPGFCDACLLDLWGTYYVCSTCSNFALCFKCYRSRDILHPDHPFDEYGLGYELESEGSLGRKSSLASDGDDGGTVSSDFDDEDENEEEDESDDGREEDQSDSGGLKEDRKTDNNIGAGEDDEATTE